MTPGAALQERRGGAPLAIHEKAVRPHGERDSGPSAEERERRDGRYRLREVLWDVSTIRRVTYCGKIAAKGCTKGAHTPEIRKADGRAYYTGVARCGSVWACPVCSPKIRHGRSLEVEAGMRSWMERGGQVLFLTLTTPHHVGDDLGELLEVLKGGWSRLFSGRPYRRDRDAFGISHWFRAWDATNGGNGWHPHLHAVLFLDAPLPPEEVQRLEEHFFQRWADAVEERGHPRPSREHGVRLEAARGRADLSRYLLKVRGEESGAALALEVTRGDLKTGGGRTPFQILGDFAATGDLRDLRLWKTWERETKGQHFARWSNGAKADLRVVERTEEEIMEEEVGGEVVYRPSPDEWIALTRTDGALWKALRIAEDEGALGVRRFARGVLTRWRRRARRRWEERQHGGKRCA